jgi:F0F1-type ATP synthase membrane subunit b/b'
MTPTAPRRTEPLLARGAARRPPPSRGARRDRDTSAAKDVADTASKNAQHVASTAMDQGQEVARSGVQQAKQVVDTSRQQATQVAQELSDHGKGLLEEARTQVQDQAQTQIQRLAQALHRLGDEAQALAGPTPGGPYSSRLRRPGGDQARGDRR